MGGKNLHYLFFFPKVVEQLFLCRAMTTDQDGVIAYNSPSLSPLPNQVDLRHPDSWKIFVLTSTKYLVNVPLKGK